MTTRHIVLWGISGMGLLLAGTARATTYAIHVGGVCSVEWADWFFDPNGATDDELGRWPGVVSVSAPVRQTDALSTAVEDLRVTLDQYCRHGDRCYLYTWSTGSAIVSKLFNTYDTPWNVGYVYAAASNEGGSEISCALGWLAEIGIGCRLARKVSPSDVRIAAWNHNDTNGTVFYHVAGGITWRWFLWWTTSVLLPGGDDGIVPLHSGGGTIAVSPVRDICSAPRWANHYIAGPCEGYDLDHVAIKRKAICNDHGGGPCK